ncbi:hypothetical protein DID75_03835 [Candidatus Marinamargulisbacteria bacterium SCGC AG-410-N11]|nr:hypothetical protein DID75_03835 [Candidatus Marinamargulisbacteria bacterium SCGC AG-410-N11]
MSGLYRITQRHYDLILNQCLKNLPKEAGGFVGGNDYFIKAVFPLFNQHLFNQTDTFSFTSEDVIRAHEFFKKHELEYFGMYHSHPNGIAYPSDADISTGHDYHFIMSLRQPDMPDFRAFKIENGQPIEFELRVVSDKGFVGKDEAKKLEDPKFKGSKRNDEAEKLGQLIDDIKSEKKHVYKKLPPIDDQTSDFSTMA